VIHFNRGELDNLPDKKKKVTLLWMSHLAILILSAVNFINNCIQAGAGMSGAGIRIFYSFLFMVIINPI
jgi:hypothetical protein